jgi:hypothetical protein
VRAARFLFSLGMQCKGCSSYSYCNILYCLAGLQSLQAGIFPATWLIWRQTFTGRLAAFPGVCMWLWGGKLDTHCAATLHYS